LKNAAGLLDALTAITCLVDSPESVPAVSPTIGDNSAARVPPVSTGRSFCSWDSLSLPIEVVAVGETSVDSCAVLVADGDIACSCRCCCCCSRFAVVVPVPMPSLDRRLVAALFSVDIL
jgi:hypothetical protein